MYVKFNLNMWRSWCIMHTTELLERSDSRKKRLVDFLGDCSKHCFTITVWFSVLTDCGRPLRVNVVRYTSIPSPSICPRGALLWDWLENFCLEIPPKLSLTLSNWFCCKIDLFNLDFSSTEYLAGWSIEAGKLHNGSLTTVYLEYRSLG